MKTAKTSGLLIAGLFLFVFLISITSAQTLVAGKIYNSEYSDIISDADVTVTCNSHVLETDSLDDGTYAVRFDVDECGEGANVNAEGAKGSLYGSDSGVVIECNDRGDCAEGFVSIINLAIKPKQTTNHNNGGNNRYYLCGNDKCDSGESVTTCPRDCKIFINNNITGEPSQNAGNGDESSNNETQTLTGNNQTTTLGGVSRITGAVVGTLGTGWVVIIVFIVGILVLSLIVRFIRKRKAITERESI
ncbi:MAG: hypothetical protein PHH54_05040 [Candidatus Nanoarchaeia archaeon]|nr:hypothetical protein [Candidatus Nanoarchaeia archaeon]MDD5741324.1 hypothetical protein [Candidatus Nanoarchaeia archaeon]